MLETVVSTLNPVNTLSKKTEQFMRDLGKVRLFW